jgi:hypothetical protein
MTYPNLYPNLYDDAQQPDPRQGNQQQLDPRLIAAMLQLQQQNPQQRSIDRQMKLADALRASSSDQMQGVNAGRIHIAPNLANAASSLFQQYQAGKMGQDAELRQQNMGTQRQDAMQRYFQALTGGRRQQAPYMGAEGE